MEKCVKKFVKTAWAWHGLPRFESTRNMLRHRSIRSNETLLGHKRISSKNGPIYIANEFHEEIAKKHSTIDLNLINSKSIVKHMLRAKDVKDIYIRKIPHLLLLLSYETDPRFVKAMNELLLRLNYYIPLLSVRKLIIVYYQLGKHKNNYKIQKLQAHLLACIENKLLDYIRMQPTRNIKSIVWLYMSNFKDSELIPAIINMKGIYSQNESVLYYTLMLKTLCQTLTPPYQIMKLLDALQKQLLSMVQSFTLFDIYSTLQALSTYVAKHTTMPYNQDLIKALVSAVLASKVSNDTFVEIVNMLNNMHYADSSVIDELAVRFHRNTKLVQKDFYAAGWPLLRSMNIANHKPPQWTSLQKIISEQIEKIYHRRVWSAIPIIYIFSLDCYLPKLYVNVLNNHNAILQKSSTRLVFLWRGLQQFYPQFFVDYDCNFKNEPDEKPPSLIHLESWLTDRIGGPQYVKMNMYTKLGFFVDCVIAIRSGGYPVAISSENNDSITFVEDIKLRLGNQGIIILCWPHHAYPSNSNSLKSTWQLRLRTIEQSTGFSVIVLDMKHMNKMTDTEKMLYLMDAIKQKCAILNFEYI